MKTRSMSLRSSLLLALVAIAVAARAGDTDDLLAAVRASRQAPGPERALEQWSLGKARTAAAGVVRRNPRSPARWTDSEVLRAALLYTARGRHELVAGGASGLWFDYARDMVGSVADRPRRRLLQRDWVLAVAALHNSRYDGRSSREVLDRAVRALPDEPDVLFAAGRLYEAIAAHVFSGAATLAAPKEAQVAQVELQQALRLYERVLALQPERPDARLRRGRVLSLLRRTGAARQELERVLASPADDGLRCLASLFEGVTREQDGQPAEAEASYRRALTTGRSLSTARIALASVLWREGDGVDARETVQELLAAGAPDSDAWWLYQSEGIGENSDHEARFAALWRESGK